MSKGLGAGYMPLGAVIADEKIVDAVMANGGFAHGFTTRVIHLPAPQVAVVEEIGGLYECRPDG
jgi:adenosylmethionine-8-amino-7-oxononanoate aminotransferase